MATDKIEEGAICPGEVSRSVRELGLFQAVLF